MKPFISASLLVAVAVVGGCVSQPHGLVLDPIGPADSTLASAGSNGTLVVFSAFDSQADFNDLPYQRHYTDYKIDREDGKLVEAVRNSNGVSLDGPKRVELPAGVYRVVARANGYGVVTVPVIIRGDRVTAVHLEGGHSWQNLSQHGESNPVRLPDGEIVGWRAGTGSLPKP